MEATVTLSSEHRVIERVIDSLETGEGIHEKYLDLAERLEKELLAG